MKIIEKANLTMENALFGEKTFRANKTKVSNFDSEIVTDEWTENKTYEVTPTKDFISEMNITVNVDSITDLSGTKWTVNDVPTLTSSSKAYSINFTNSSNNYDVFIINADSIEGGDSGAQQSDTIYSTIGGWGSPASKVFQITNGTDATNTELIDWFKNNAVITEE